MTGEGDDFISRYSWAISSRMKPLQFQQRTEPVRTISPHEGQGDSTGELAESAVTVAAGGAAEEGCCGDAPCCGGMLQEQFGQEVESGRSGASHWGHELREVAILKPVSNLLEARSHRACCLSL